MGELANVLFLSVPFTNLSPIFAQSVVIIMCGSPHDVSTDLGMAEVDKDIVIILIDLFK